jgi:predicted O-linked N-acetylglucosamine transferase (SPINDLY family)
MHAVAILIAELIEIHNKEQFEFIAFSLGPDVKDGMQKRLSKAFDQFIDVRNKSDQAVAKLSRQLGIDIAIDLGGLTADCHTGIFSFRAAPIQVNYLGYPGTMGANFIDYIIADHTLIPAKSEKFYAEKIIYLPNTYQVNDRKKVISDKQFSRAELELPEDSFVFCCFNNNYKILPETFDGWMRILSAVEGSVIWLFQDNDWALNNLKEEAQKRGISEGRLVFAKRLPLPEHLARHRQADLFLDTFPCNAHTTTSDALWAGLPVLTLMGESFASRVAASLLTAIDLPELITSSQEHYEALAIELATNPAKLKVIKAKLEANRLTTPLFDTPRFTKHLEDAYTKMYERYHADLPPEHIYIEDEAKTN